VILLLAFAGLLGLAIGSFLNVVIYRLPRGQNPRLDYALDTKPEKEIARIMIKATMDLNALLQYIDLDQLLANVDLDAILARIDMEAMLNRIDINAMVARIDINTIVDQVDIDKVIAGVDVEGLMSRTELGGIIAKSTTGVMGEALDAIRRQGVRLDNLIAAIVDRVFRREKLGITRLGPPLLVPVPALPAADEPADLAPESA